MRHRQSTEWRLVGPSVATLTTVSTIDPSRTTIASPNRRTSTSRNCSTDPAVRNERTRTWYCNSFRGWLQYPLEAGFAGDRQISNSDWRRRVEALFPNPDHALRPGNIRQGRVSSIRRKGRRWCPSARVGGCKQLSDRRRFPDRHAITRPTYAV